jgi:acyl carrier protein
MRRSEIFEAMEEATLQPPGTVHGDEALNAITGWDSLSGTEFRLIVLDRWDIQISGLALEKCATVADLLRLFGDRISD